MYNNEMMARLTAFLQSHSGAMDKEGLSQAVKDEFSLVLDRKLYYCDAFAIRFCKAAKRNFSNTVLSLSALQKYDDRPFIVCVVTPSENVPYLANTTFLSKISHSSQQLRMDNIKGSFNGSDIMKMIGELENKPENFEALFLSHETFTFQENLERLVEKTNAIVPTGAKYQPDEEALANIKSAPARAAAFLASGAYTDLKQDLDNRVFKVQNEIAIAAFIDNVNIRGRIIEYLITSDGGNLREQIIDCLQNEKPLPKFKTEDQLGDYQKDYEGYKTAVEIKTKVLFLKGNPKAYNIDKLLAFLGEPDSIYMIYIVGIDDDGNISPALCSVFDEQLLDGTTFLFHWAGRNSRGVTQFMGNSMLDILTRPEGRIDKEKADAHIECMLSL